MAYVKWTLLGLLALVVAGFLNYTLPHRDIVRIVSTETRRVDFGANSIFWSHAGAGDAVSAENRDVFFINAVRPNGKVVVYRNQDTGWGWPPYFKFDTSDLQARASDLVSTKDKPQWAVVRAYGWRNKWFSIFPNAVKVYAVSGPDVRLIPWFNIAVLVVLAGVFRFLQVRLRRLRQRWFGDEGKTA